MSCDVIVTSVMSLMTSSYSQSSKMAENAEIVKLYYELGKYPALVRTKLQKMYPTSEILFESK